MRRILLPYLIQLTLSPRLLNFRRKLFEWRRARSKQPHLLTVYLRINDPHSYLLLQVLSYLKQRFGVEYEFHTVLHLDPAMYPAFDLWQKNSFEDAAYLANVYSEGVSFKLKFPPKQPESSSEFENKVTAQLLHWELQPGYLENALALFHAYWHEDTKALVALINPVIAENTQSYRHHLEANEALLKKRGHYLSGMIHYGGEWYWGFSRLFYLEQRLQQLTEQSEPLIFIRGVSSKPPSSTKSARTLQIFYSARSPYSYLGLVKARILAERYDLQLKIKPLLPMVMRRMQVPKQKASYIAKDVAREAAQANIPFGKIADPLGKGVENIYALYSFAEAEGKALEYLESAARGVWSEGVYADSEKGMQRIVERAALNWQSARSHLHDESWRIWAQQNLLDLYSHGQWGVPCFVYGDLLVFGQDRLDRIEDAILA